MLAVYLSPLYILVNVYIVRRLLGWMGACCGVSPRCFLRLAAALAYTCVALTPLIGFLLPVGQGKRFFTSAGYYWMGVLLYGILFLAALELVRLIRYLAGKRQPPCRRLKVLAGAAVLSLTAAVSLWGIVNARIIHTTDYAVTVDKEAGKLQDLKIVLTADLHLGYNIGSSQMEQMVEKINREEPDLVVIAGDIFDNEYEALKDPEELIRILKGISSRYGVYACYGNHDIDEKILSGFTFDRSGDRKESDPRMDAFLEEAGIILLHDEGVLIDDSFYLFGRADAGKPGRGIEKRLSPEEITEGLDPDKPLIVLDHEPSQLPELAAAGVDVDLGGHTHDGQVFPVDIVMEFLWENPCGYLRKGQMHSIVTSGAGLFGPNMRVGTKAEICVVDVQFAP